MSTERRAEAIWLESKLLWRIRVQSNGVTKEFTSSVKGRKGKRIVEDKADEWLESGTSDMRFQQAWDQFLDYERENTGTANVRKHVSIYDNYLKPIIKVRRLSDITPITWQRCINSGAEAGLSKRSCANIRATITSFYRFCRRNRWTVNTIEDGDLTIPKSAAPAKPKNVLQPDAIRALFEDPTIIYYNKKRIATFSYCWQFAVVTGLRRGELAGLRNEDVKDNILSIKRAINSTNEITDGKNANARRTIELTPTAMAVLRRQRAFLMQQGIVSPWIFPDEFGERPNPNRIYDQWRSWCAQHGLNLSMHELRHTFISLNKSDLPIELMKAVVGHSSSMDTYAVYGHEVDGERHRAAEIVQGVLDRIIPDNK